jgi:hypothetical protein
MDPNAHNDEEDFNFEDEAPAGSVVVEDEDEFEIVTTETQFANPEDEGRPVATADTPVTEVTDEDLDKIQKESIRTRMKALSAQAHEQRRRAEIAEQERAELLRALRVSQERTFTTTAAAVSAARQALQAQLDTATREYKEAHEIGDVDKQLAAQMKLQQVTSQLSMVPDDATVQRDVEAERARLAAQMQAQQAQQATFDPRVTAWVKKNPWFDTDPVLREAATLAARQLEVDGAVPVGSDAYFSAIETAVKAIFPKKFASMSPPAPPPPPSSSRVAPVVRSNTAANGAKTGKKTITFTPAMRSIALQLAPPGMKESDALLAYAKEYARLNPGS